MKNLKKRIFKPKFLMIFIIVIISCVNILSLMNISSLSFINKKKPTELKNIAPKSSFAYAWGSNGTAISTAFHHQLKPQITQDEAEGAIITWHDYRSGTNYDIYAKRINSVGGLEWNLNGTEICTASNNQYFPQITDDRAGGAIITWQDYRSGTDYDIYAQRIDAAGSVKWLPDGVPISTAINIQQYPQIICDGTGGAIITWQDYRNGTNYDIYAQRINATGSVKWLPDGVPICISANDQLYPQITNDGIGGAIITWQDPRNGINYDIYAQKINLTGDIEWSPNGVEISSAINSQYYPKIISDGVRGAIISWYDKRSGTHLDIYAQRINATGNVKWLPNGVPICTTSNDQKYQQIIDDGVGGAIITWQDYRSGIKYDIYSQRISATGSVKWLNDGIPICTAPNDQDRPQITTDGAEGAIIAWRDYRSGIYYDIYSQRINSEGDLKWTSNGITVIRGNKFQGFPQITNDRKGGEIITWGGTGNGTFYDVYAQRIKNIVPFSSHSESLITSINGFETLNWTLYDDSGGGKYRVLVNDTNGNTYEWLDWTVWFNNTAMTIPINRTVSGIFNYTIEYYDDQNQFGNPNTIIVTITNVITINGDETIPFGNYYLIIAVFSIISLLIIRKTKTYKSQRA